MVTSPMPNKATVETTYSDLKKAIDQALSMLESEDIDVDQAIKAYERGMKAAKELETYLKSAQNKVTKIKKSFEK